MGFPQETMFIMKAYTGLHGKSAWGGRALVNTVVHHFFLSKIDNHVLIFDLLSKFLNE